MSDVIKQSPRDSDRNPVRLAALPRGGGAGRTAWYVWTLFGNPQEGTFQIAVKVGATTENITVDWDADESDIQTALATHSLITEAQVVTSTTGGKFPQSEIKFRFTGGLKTEDVTFPSHAVLDNLAGGFNMHLLIRKVSC